MNNYRLTYKNNIINFSSFNEAKEYILTNNIKGYYVYIVKEEMLPNIDREYEEDEELEYTLQEVLYLIDNDFGIKNNKL